MRNAGWKQPQPQRHEHSAGHMPLTQALLAVAVTASADSVDVAQRQTQTIVSGMLEDTTLIALSPTPATSGSRVGCGSSAASAATVLSAQCMSH